MTTAPAQDAASPTANYWHTDVIDIEPGRIHVRDYPIQELIGQIGFAEMIQLMLRGELPAKRQTVLLETALVASVDHDPHVPSVAIAEMTTSCGLPLNGAMASTLDTLGDVHGGVGQQAIELSHDIKARMFGDASLEATTAAGIDTFIAAHGKYLPGFGHHFRSVDPRAGRLLALVDRVAQNDVAGERYATIGRTIEALLSSRKGRPIPMNIDGATVVIYAELGFATPPVRGMFCPSRTVGIPTHAWEQSNRDEHNKGPVPHQLPYRYTGHVTRHLVQTGPAPAP